MRAPDVRLVVDLDHAIRVVELAVNIPRGRWYLKLREKTRSPEAASADTIVSPSKPQ